MHKHSGHTGTSGVRASDSWLKTPFWHYLPLDRRSGKRLSRAALGDSSCAAIRAIWTYGYAI
eukprot:940905-Heterocapsa_arctica.AAC.1